MIGTYAVIKSGFRSRKTTRISGDLATVMVRVFARLLILATAGAPKSKVKDDSPHKHGPFLIMSHKIEFAATRYFGHSAYNRSLSRYIARL